MKVLGLILLLFFSVSATEVKPKISNDITEYIEIVKCFLNQDNLINDIVSLVDIVKSGEYDKLLSLAFKLYADGTSAVKECIKKEEINLEGIIIVPPNLTKEMCTKYCHVKYAGYLLEICLSFC